MANFKSAYKFTMTNEGGYCDDPKDRGGETFAGIARKASLEGKNWPGWEIIDREKLTFKNLCKKTWPAFTQVVYQRGIEEYVQAFYKQYYWDIFRGDNIQNDAMATAMFDMGTNCGQGKMIKWVQTLCNRYPGNQLVLDGSFGNKSLARFNQLLTTEPPYYLLQGLCDYLEQHYASILSRDSSQQRFKKSWYSRLQRLRNLLPTPKAEINTWG